MIWREKIDSVVAPTEISWKIRDWHHFNDGDADAREFFQLFGRRPPRSLFGKRADVHFVNDVAFHFHAGPIGIRPFELPRIDSTRRPMRAVWLKARRRIGMKMLGLVYAKTVERSGASISDS